jgi:exonuclease III
LHYQSKRNWNTADQSAHASVLKSEIEKIEDEQGHKRTIVCGDFNMNPFEDGLVQHSGFHAVMEKEIVRRRTRKVLGKEYHFFYNPMWGFLGDLGRGQVSGTMYYSPANSIVYHWNLYDQVLIRPDLINYFNDAGLDIVTQIGSTNLLTQRRRIDPKISDHLPIKFELNI